MFDNILRKLKELEKGKIISVPIAIDENGYLDKQCHSNNCGFRFKIHSQDWENIGVGSQVYCPMCRHADKADEWFNQEQIEHAKSEASAVLRGQIHNAFLEESRKFNQQQNKGNLIKWSMKVPGGLQRTYVLPAQSAEIMQLEIKCEFCSTRFAVIGSGFFCPKCGKNSVRRMFMDSLRKIRAKSQNVEITKKALLDAVGKDEAELTCRSLLESCIGDGVTAFQKYCDGLYEPFGTAPFNAFQRLDTGDTLWRHAVSSGYSDWISPSELRTLSILYQKRHILAHNDGIVDEKYLARSGDASYQVGQRIVIVASDAEAVSSILEKLANGLSSAIAKYQQGLCGQKGQGEEQ